MKHLFYYLFLFTSAAFCQESIEATFIKKTKLEVDKFIGVNTFDAKFYITNNIFTEEKEERKLVNAEYSNIQLGEITSANIFNPLKINLFYKPFNTVVILDNRLAEIVKINFNNLQPFRDITHVSTGNDNSIWCFNQNTLQLELFDYLTHKTRAKTLPIEGRIIDIYSNYNFCWLMTDAFMYCYNYFGSLISKIPNNSYSSVQINNGNTFFLKENKLFFKAKDTSKILEIKLTQLLIKQFLVTNETLYIYDDIFLYHYQLITN